jgi:hypothetical protein
MIEKVFTFWRSLVGKKAAPSPLAHDDRRLWVRYAADLQGSLHVGDASHAKLLANVRDLSVGGANLIVDRPLTLGQMVTLELPARDEMRTVLACVVRVHRDPSGGWLVGCVFSRELSTDDLDRIGAQKTPAGADDNRRWVRYPCRFQTSFQKVSDKSGPAHPAEVLNISANGIGLAIQPSLQAGTLLNVNLSDQNGKPIRTLLACVVHTTARAGGDHAVGCNFIRELSDDELRSLL